LDNHYNHHFVFGKLIQIPPQIIDINNVNGRTVRNARPINGNGINSLSQVKKQRLKSIIVKNMIKIVDSKLPKQNIGAITMGHLNPTFGCMFFFAYEQYL